MAVQEFTYLESITWYPGTFNKKIINFAWFVFARNSNLFAKKYKKSALMICLCQILMKLISKHNSLIWASSRGKRTITYSPSRTFKRGVVYMSTKKW